MNEGDRMCPDCDTDSLVEKGLIEWVCLNPTCGTVHLTKDLDFGIELDDEDE